jgi:enoyl-CoA hydratase/carnithine racemase
MTQAPRSAALAADLEIRTHDGLCVVTLNRPARRNAVTLAMWQGLAAHFSAMAADRSVRAAILTGAGSDFSAGADISEFSGLRDDAAQAHAYEVAVDAACAAIARAPQPVIAVNRGYTLGGGAHLAMSADFRFAAPDAQFGIPAARLSIVYGVQATRKLLALVGLTQAKRILYSAQRFGAAEALKIGFVDRLAEDPMAEAAAFAAELMALAPLSQGGAKYILNGLTLGAFDPSQAEALIDAAAASRDYAEGRAAFATRRAPRFEGL